MADNYLERRREQYEARKAEWLKKKRHLPLRTKKTSEEEGKAADKQKK